MINLVIAAGTALFAMLAVVGMSVLENRATALSVVINEQGTTAFTEARQRLADALPFEETGKGLSPNWTSPAEIAPNLGCAAEAGKPTVCSPVTDASIKACLVKQDASSSGGEVKEGFFVSTEPSASLERPVAFVLRLDPKKVGGDEVARREAAQAVCGTLTQRLIVSKAALTEADVVALRQAGASAWAAVSVRDVYQTKRPKDYLKAPVATEEELASVEKATGDVRLVKNTGRLVRYTGDAWVDAVGAAMTEPIANKGNYSPPDGNPYFRKQGLGGNHFTAIPITQLPGGVVVPPFFIGTHEVRYFNTSEFNAERLAHDGFRNYASQGWSEPAPLTGYTWRQAKAACESMGGSLPTLHQWLAVATQLAANPTNWPSGVQGVGAMPAGVQSLPAPIFGGRWPTEYYYGLPSTDAAQRRVLSMGLSTTSTSERVWDLAGNAAEWIDHTAQVGTLPLGDASASFCEWGKPCGAAPTEELFPAVMRPSKPGIPGGWLKATSAQGGLATNNVEASGECTGPCSSVAAFAMGGRTGEAGAGVFTLDTRWGRAYSSPFIGFRCVLPLNTTPRAIHPF